MLRITQINETSEKLIKEISKEIRQLTKLNKNISKNKIKIQKSINLIHFKLNEYEYIQNLKPHNDKPITKKNIESEKNIQRKLKIKSTSKIKQSKSFLKWLINNKEI
ncbi:MAG: hypothetical protein HRU03_09200 [Nanoarchaeales archaeon]|nr:hypothetical protein [Nanoarchaeales archaeon]